MDGCPMDAFLYPDMHRPQARPHSSRRHLRTSSGSCAPACATSACCFLRLTRRQQATARSPIRSINSTARFLISPTSMRLGASIRRSGSAMVGPCLNRSAQCSTSEQFSLPLRNISRWPVPGRDVDLDRQNPAWTPKSSTSCGYLRASRGERLPRRQAHAV
jgi:hypothetical protein